jgi:exodeoxyribonuclease VII large subunit
MNQLEIISVSQYLDKLNSTLKGEKAKIVGEVSGVQEYPGRSYLYFSIKDSKDGSTIKCFMWKNDYKISGVILRDGLEIIITAYPSIYKPNGGISMQVEMVEMVGEGALQIAYEKLKKKLELEGLFSLDRKREIPMFPQKIGVITSKSGAVINDFLTNIGKHGFEIQFVDSKVEGQEAVKDLLSAIKTLKTKRIDVLVIMRGGGSLESFQAFNNEVLVRAVVDFPVPVLTGIGHDKDAPLVSMVSDKNVSTPTAVANILNTSWNEALALLRLGEEKIFLTYGSILRDKQFIIENSQINIKNSFNSIFDTFRKGEQTLLQVVSKTDFVISEIRKNILRDENDLERGFRALISSTKESIVQYEKFIEQSNPERLLKRGYSITRNNGKIVRSKGDVKRGDELDILLADGIINTKAV